MRTKRVAVANPDDLGEVESLHRIPVIDKMMQLLEVIETAAAEGVATGEIVARTRIPRSTVYRILNTLSSHGILARTEGGGYRLGFRLMSLAANVRTSFSEAELAAIVQPHLDRLAVEVEETCKFSVLKEVRAEVLAVAQSPNPLAPFSRAGSSFELHAGAASKLLLAHAPTPVRERFLEGEHRRYTEATIVGRARLEAELEAITREDLSRDRGEWNASVHAIAAPVRDGVGTVVGALSVTYFAVEAAAFVERILTPLVAASDRISGALGYQPRSSSPIARGAERG